MKHDFIIFGGTGQQGRICARDLLESGYRVLLFGRDPSKLGPILKHKHASFMKIDLDNPKDLAKAINNSGAEVLVNCAELDYNMPLMRAALAAKRPYVDLGGLHNITIEQFKLDQAFKRAGITAITGCGSTPGITNVMAAYAARDFDKLETIETGFAWDSNMKQFVVPYSLKSIFNEFNDPPVVLRKGAFVSSNRHECKGLMQFREIGKQMCYCIVHSEVYTYAKYFKHKGLKNVYYYAGFPDHSFNKIKTLMELGFDSKEPIEFNGVSMRPIDITAQVLKKLRPPKGYQEVENLWVIMEGTKKRKSARVKMECIVRTLKGWEDAGSNVNTGRTIAIIAEMLKLKTVKTPGVYAPEAIVPHGEFFDELAERQMYVYANGVKIN